MDFFNTYTSNTLAGSGNQTYFTTEDPQRIYKSRALYRVFCGGAYNYSVLFSNILDSTFSDGSFSRKNMIIDSWRIHGMRLGIVSACDETSMQEPYAACDVTFDGKTEKTVAPGELFGTDPVKLAPKEGEYICLEMAFSGDRIPYHEESIIPSFVLEGESWVPSKRHPFASMLGCDRGVRQRIAFLGDSITQGIGTPVNSYAHWNSVVAERIGREYAYWNLGLGYGRAEDAASDGAWLFKAKQNDIVVVCYGVNDILNGSSEEAIKGNLQRIVDLLHASGVKVILQTVPPFDYEGERIAVWEHVNAFLREELSREVELLFDCAALLGKGETEPHKAPYGGHPNVAGCKLWGDRLSLVMKEYWKACV